MSINRTAGICFGAMLTLGGLGLSSAASAADLPVKAIPVATPWVLDVHGYADLTFATTRVTPGGLMVRPSRGVTTQIDTGLALDIYKNKTGFINGFTVFGGVWNEYWDSPAAGASSWQEQDWWAGFSVKFAQYWKFTAQSLQFQLPGGPTAYNYVFSLALDDSFLGLPVTFNPYVNVFDNAAGFSTVILGKNSYRVELGMVPTYSFLKSTGVPLTVTMPTWVTVGPSDYWNRNDGTTNLCGTAGTSPCSLSNVGLVSTGLQGRLSLESVVPKRLGNWYLKAGFQYYHITNDALLAAQVATGAATSFNNSHRDIVVGSTGLGFSF